MMNKKQKDRIFICTVFTVSTLVLGAILVMAIPSTPTSAHEYVESNWNCIDHDFWYIYPSTNSDESYEFGIIEINVTKEDFDNEIKNRYLRNGGYMIGCGHFIDPNNKFVRQIADLFNERTVGCTEEQKAICVMDFVDSNIYYYSDLEVYGSDEYWATPTETLYLKRGDCEDRAILTCSIFIAMGLDGALLEYSDHIAPAIRYQGTDEYYSADLHYTHPRDSLEYYDGSMPKIYNDTNIGYRAWSKLWGTYRYGMCELFGV